MKKFSKIFENKQFHNWNVDMIKNKLKEIPNSTEVVIDTLFTYHTQDGDEICDQDDKNLHDDALVSPLFICQVKFDFKIRNSYSFEENDKQSDSWVGELLNWKIYSDFIKNISKVLEDFEDDFYVFMNSFETNLDILNASRPSQKGVSIQFEMIMKDKFDKEIMG